MTGQVIGCAYTVRNTLGSGFLERVYENALADELRKQGIAVAQQHPTPVFYDGIQVGEYYADLLVEDELVVELKASKTIDEIHMAQILNYLRATRIHRGLILNFGTPRVQVKRVVLGP